MSWRPDSPVELANGQLVCKRHGMIRCESCWVDYSFSTPDAAGTGYEYNDMDDDDFTIVIPREFHPPRLADTPDSLFSQRVLPGMARPRFVRKTDKNQVIFWTDGACLNNGKANPSAGGGFVFSTPNVKHDGKYHGIHFRLENEGPNGNIEAQTSNRAELRAVIAALEFKDRSPEGWKSLVIATDSEYVVHGATDWITKWMDNNWKRSSGDAVKNRDLWELLMDNISRYEELGIEILFWKIPRELNKLADQKAKEGAALPAIDEWNPVYVCDCCAPNV